MGGKRQSGHMPAMPYPCPVPRAFHVTRFQLPSSPTGQTNSETCAAVHSLVKSAGSGSLSSHVTAVSMSEGWGDPVVA